MDVEGREIERLTKTALMICWDMSGLVFYQFSIASQKTICHVKLIASLLFYVSDTKKTRKKNKKLRRRIINKTRFFITNVILGRAGGRLQFETWSWKPKKFTEILLFQDFESRTSLRSRHNQLWIASKLNLLRSQTFTFPLLPNPIIIILQISWKSNEQKNNK